jgi:uncharacterized protein (DUF1778 family)
MNMGTKTQARFDARLTREQKELFEKATLLGGYRNLTDFVVLTVQERAKEIIEEKEQVIASKKDSEIFFNTITKNIKPTQSLVDALEAYNSFVKNTTVQ